MAEAEFFNDVHGATLHDRSLDPPPSATPSTHAGASLEVTRPPSRRLCFHTREFAIAGFREITGSARGPGVRGAAGNSNLERGSLRATRSARATAPKQFETLESA